MIKWEVDKIAKRQFGFNFFILTAWKLKNQLKTGDYAFLLVDRKRLDKIFVLQIDSTKDMEPNIEDIKNLSDLYSGICWINTQIHIGIFAPSKDNKKEIDEAIKTNVSCYRIRDFFYRHSECLTFWGVIVTIIALIWSICCGK